MGELTTVIEIAKELQRAHASQAHSLRQSIVLFYLKKINKRFGVQGAERPNDNAGRLVAERDHPVEFAAPLEDL